jgi:hypothetical protein
MTEPNKMKTAPEVRLGHVKTFGARGPAYVVTGSARPTNQGDWLIPIVVAVSGEELDYPYSRFVEDPDEEPACSIPITQAQRDELDRRMGDVHQHPQDGISWEMVKDHIIDRA